MPRRLEILAINLYLLAALGVLLVTLRGPFRRLRPGRRPPAERVASGPRAAAAHAPTERRRRELPDRLVEILACPNCGAPYREEAGELRCGSGHRVPITRNIPRFVPDEAYAASFGFEWNLHSSTQLDSVRGDDVSARTLAEKTGLDPTQVAGRLVLDAGVGSGRFSEVLAGWGAHVVGVDLSSAVEAAARNLAGHEHVWIAQADLRRLPFAPGTFDMIVSIGVLHHTPDTRAAFEALVPLLAPGGTIAIWVYPRDGMYPIRADWIPFTSRLPPAPFHRWCRWLVGHMSRLGDRLPARLVYDLFPYNRGAPDPEWDVLDTFDGFSPRHHGVHSAEEVEEWFRACGLEAIEVLGTATAVRGRRPAAAA